MVNLLTCAGFEPLTQTLVGLGVEFESAFSVVAEINQGSDEEIYAVAVIDADSGEVLGETEPMAVASGSGHATIAWEMELDEGSAELIVRLVALNRGTVAERSVRVRS